MWIFKSFSNWLFFHTRLRTKHYIMCHSTSHSALPSCMLIILSHTKKKSLLVQLNFCYSSQCITLYCSSVGVNCNYCSHPSIFVSCTYALCYSIFHKTSLYRLKWVCLATVPWQGQCIPAGNLLWPQLLQQRSSPEKVQRLMFLPVQCLK